MNNPLDDPLDGLLTNKAAAERLGIRENTFRKQRHRDGGLNPVRRLGRSPLFRPEDVDAWGQRARKPRGRPAGQKSILDAPDGWMTALDIVNRLAELGYRRCAPSTVSLWVSRGEFPKSQLARKGHQSVWDPKIAEAGIQRILATKRGTRDAGNRKDDE